MLEQVDDPDAQLYAQYFKKLGLFVFVHFQHSFQLLLKSYIRNANLSSPFENDRGEVVITCPDGWVQFRLTRMEVELVSDLLPDPEKNNNKG